MHANRQYRTISAPYDHTSTGTANSVLVIVLMCLSSTPAVNSIQSGQNQPHKNHFQTQFEFLIYYASNELDLPCTTELTRLIYSRLVDNHVGADKTMTDTVDSSVDCRPPWAMTQLIGTHSSGLAIIAVLNLLASAIFLEINSVNKKCFWSTARHYCEWSAHDIVAASDTNT